MVVFTNFQILSLQKSKRLNFKKHFNVLVTSFSAATSKRDTKTSLQTMVNSSTCSPASPLRKPTLDVSEIVRESPDFTKAIKK